MRVINPNHTYSILGTMMNSCILGPTLVSAALPPVCHRGINASRQIWITLTHIHVPMALFIAIGAFFLGESLYYLIYHNT